MYAQIEKLQNPKIKIFSKKNIIFQQNLKTILQIKKKKQKFQNLLKERWNENN